MTFKPARLLLALIAIAASFAYSPSFAQNLAVVNGKAIPGQVLATQYEISQLAPGGANTFKVRAKNVCAQASAFATLAVPTVAEVDSPGVLLAQVYRTATDGTAFGGAGQDGIDTVIGDAKYPNSPDDVYYVNGFQFGEPDTPSIQASRSQLAATSP